METKGAKGCAWKETECVVLETQSGVNSRVDGKEGEALVEETQSEDVQLEARRAGAGGEAEEVVVACDGKAEVGEGG